MHRKHHNGQLSVDDFHARFGDTLDPGNRWVLFSTLMPWQELEEPSVPEFKPTTAALAKPIEVAFEALFIKLGVCGLPMPACRSRHQRSPCCCGQKSWKMLDAGN